MVRMRTAKSLLREIQTQVPDTEITLHYLRKLIASGAIPVVHVGRKNLVDMDLVLDYLSNSRYHDTDQFIGPFIDDPFTDNLFADDPSIF